MTTLKIYNHQNRIVAAASQKAAAQALGISAYELKNYASITGNEAQVEAATRRPGIVLVESYPFTSIFHAEDEGTPDLQNLIDTTLDNICHYAACIEKASTSGRLYYQKRIADSLSKKVESLQALIRTSQEQNN